MTLNKRAANAYRNVEVSSAVPYADSVQLIQMLFDGLIASLSDAEGHFERNDIKGKNESIGKANKIIIGLQSALDFEKGKEMMNSEEFKSIQEFRHANTDKDHSSFMLIEGGDTIS